MPAALAMTRRSPISDELIGALYGKVSGAQAPRGLLGLVADCIKVDAIWLGLDLGNGYRHDCFIGDAVEQVVLDLATARQAFPLTCASPFRREAIATPALPNGWIDQRPLPVGTAGRRGIPRSGIALLRSPVHPAFNPAERGRLTLLLPHLNHAITLMHELDCSRKREACAFTALEHVDHGILLLDPTGTVMHSNTRAHMLLDAARVRHDAPRLRLPTRALQQRYEAALEHAAQRESVESATFLLPAATPVVLTVHPAAADAPAYGNLSASLTLTVRGQCVAAHLPACVAGHFGLTPAEFRLCAALVEGANLKACAQNWNRSYDTLRSQLKTIFSKTGTHRQVELIALLEAFKTP